MANMLIFWYVQGNKKKLIILLFYKVLDFYNTHIESVLVRKLNDSSF